MRDSPSRLPHSRELTAVKRGVAHLAGCQGDAGSLVGPYDGPLFVTPGYVFAHYATGTVIPETQRAGLRDHIVRVQNADGGFGLHLEGPSLLFTTVLNYVALRLLGGDSEPARGWIRARGGAVGVPSWGKYWLAVLGLYDWQGTNPVLPELLLQPRWSPCHPRRFWCHTRVVYNAIAYLRGARWQISPDSLIDAIRADIFLSTPDWRRARAEVRREDVLVAPRSVSRVLDQLMLRIDSHLPGSLRVRGLATALAHVEHEESATDFLALGPVNKALNCVVLHAAASPLAAPSIAALPRYLHAGERGLAMRAYPSSELWDTTLAVHALADVEAASDLVARARRYVIANQVVEDVPAAHAHHRDRSRGGWAFTQRAHGWPVVDCTAESVVAVRDELDHERLVDAVDMLLAWQNRDGGWPTYERRRGSRLLELLNTSELFADIMVEYSHVELTASAIGGLNAAQERLGSYRAAALDRARTRGERFLRTRQRVDGSWEGAWGICFTYGTWFGIRGLRAAGAGRDDPAIRRALRFLLAIQRPDGGWGESWQSCTRRRYVPHPDGSQTVMTAWALLGLLHSGAEDLDAPIARAVEWLVDAQLDDGDWPQRSVTGVFNRTCMLDYRYYRNIFPLWALDLARRRGVDSRQRPARPTPVKQEH